MAPGASQVRQLRTGDAIEKGVHDQRRGRINVRRCITSRRETEQRMRERKVKRTE